MKKISIVVILFLLGAAAAVIYMNQGNDGSPFFRSGTDSLNCVIMMDSRLSSVQGRGVGFSYELLRNYGDASTKRINILPDDGEVWKKLGRDVDIIVIDSVATQVPDNIREKTCYGIPVAKNIVMIFDRSNHDLINNVNFWISTFKRTRQYERMCSRFFRSYKLSTITNMDAIVTYLSPYDDIIQKYSRFVGVDWILITSIVYQESQYYLGAKSQKSAQGLMQLKPSTAALYGVDDLYDPELNIKAGTLHYQHLASIYQKEGLDSVNVMKFALASYNAGEQRIADCRDYASERGYDRNDWDSVAASLSDHPTFMGTQTKAYVNEIIDRYIEYKAAIEHTNESLKVYRE